MGSEVLFIEVVKVEALDRRTLSQYFPGGYHGTRSCSGLNWDAVLLLYDMKSLKGELCQCSFAPLKLCWTRNALLQKDI